MFRDEIDAIILDPNYSLSHHVILKETEKDSRIFVTEIPEENLDDDPENDLAYDSFEIKVNYPLPYPQILGSGMRKKVRGNREMLGDCELEYIKKNGEYLNDFDQDEEIEEKERLQFPIWQGPDYENNDKKAYLMSNMIFNKIECKSLDQKEFINKDSIFRVKIINENTRDDEKYFYLDNGNKKIKIRAHKTTDLKTYISKPFIIANNDKGLEFDEEKGEYYKIIDNKKMQAIIMLEGNDKEIKALLNAKETKAKVNEKAYAVWTLNRELQAQYDPRRDKEDYEKTLTKFLRTAKTISDLGYNAITELSPVSREIQEVFLNNKKLKIFYFSGHGIIDKDGNPMLCYYSDKPVDTSSYGMDNITISTTDVEVEFVFLNSCLTGKVLMDKNGNYIKDNYWSKAFKAESVAGWKVESSLKNSEDFAKDFFIRLKKDKPKDFCKELLEEHFNGKNEFIKGFIMGDPEYTFEKDEKE